LATPSILDLPVFADASNAEIFDVGVFGGGGGFGRGGFFGGFGRFGGGGYLRGAQPGRDNDPSSGSRPATTFNGSDVVYFSAVSDAYKEITGIESVPTHRQPEGAFFQYGYFHFGVPSFSTPGWSLPSGEATGDSIQRPGEDQPAQAGTPPTAGRGAAGGRTPPGGMVRRRPTGGRMAGLQQARGGAAAGGSGADVRVLKGLEAGGIDAFVDWSAFNHSTLGEVEIGGFIPYAATNPPADQLAELGEKHGAFLVKLAGMLPRVAITDTEVEDHGGGVFSVTVEVENSGFFPTSLRHGQVSRSVQATTVQIQVPPEGILTGAAKTARIPNLAGSGSRESFTWVIRGREGSQVEIKLRAQKGGTDSATVTLR
jgi:hypothetical protein